MATARKERAEKGPETPPPEIYLVNLLGHYYLRQGQLYVEKYQAKIGSEELTIQGIEQETPPLEFFASLRAQMNGSNTIIAESSLQPYVQKTSPTTAKVVSPTLEQAIAKSEQRYFELFHDLAKYQAKEQYVQALTALKALEKKAREEVQLGWTFRRYDLEELVPQERENIVNDYFALAFNRSAELETKLQDTSSWQLEQYAQAEKQLSAVYISYTELESYLTTEEKNKALPLLSLSLRNTRLLVSNFEKYVALELVKKAALIEKEFNSRMVDKIKLEAKRLIIVRQRMIKWMPAGPEREEAERSNQRYLKSFNRKK